VILLNRGQLTHDTDTEAGLAAYRQQSATRPEVTATRNLGPELTLAGLEFSPAPARVFDDLGFELRLTAQSDCRVHDVCLLVYNDGGQRVAIADLRQSSGSYAVAAGETLTLAGSLQRIALVPGAYEVGLYLRTNQHLGDHHALRSVEILPAANSQIMTYAAQYLGSVALAPAFTAKVTS
jgi:hypothetical protein